MRYRTPPLYAVLGGDGSITATGTLRSLSPGVELTEGEPSPDFLRERRLVPLDQLPQDSLTHWSPPSHPTRGQTFLAPDGSRWVYQQPRDPDGQFRSDDPVTPEDEAAFTWVRV